MFEWLWSLIDWLRSLFFREEMEVTLVGLQNSGKTTLVNLFAVRILFDFPNYLDWTF